MGRRDSRVERREAKVESGELKVEGEVRLMVDGSILCERFAREEGHDEGCGQEEQDERGVDKEFLPPFIEVGACHDVEGEEGPAERGGTPREGGGTSLCVRPGAAGASTRG